MPLSIDDAEKHKSKTTQHADTKSIKRLTGLSFAVLGVVFGDIATSPIYAIRECFYGEYGIPISPDNIMGILSLMFWTLTIIVGVKYLIFVFRADNRGEGGVIALTALLGAPKAASDNRRTGGAILLGLFAACLLYGDGMITPAISVLSAVEGIGFITPLFDPYIIPLTIAILIGLFFIQRRGTAQVGILFGPVILLWMCFLAVTGTVQIIHRPQVLTAVWPWYALHFLIQNKLHGLVVLGAVFLVVTGTEALYADMGHFGTRPIRLIWFLLVFPALALNYFGQGALLLYRPEAAHHPFYAMVPAWGIVPTVFLTALATIIASQAVISGAFSMTRQAMQLGYLPRLTVRHTAVSQMGQIYIAPVNWMLMTCTIALVVGFQSSSRLAAAYGVAVTSTMLITDTLFFIVTRQRWQWPMVWAVPLVGLFFLADLPFFMANISKIPHGAWFPLAIGAVFFSIMLTWAKGRRILADQLRSNTMTVHQFMVELVNHPPNRIEGDAVYLTSSPRVVPLSLAQNLKHNRVVHERAILLHFQVEDAPRVPNLEKLSTEKLGSGLHLLIVRHGFMEDPRLDTLLTLAREQGLDLTPETTSFFIGHANLVAAEDGAMSRWRSTLFIFMNRNATNATSFYDLPVDRVIEVGVRLVI